MSDVASGISLETWERIAKVFRKTSCIDQVILYGSRAKGNFRNGSDIDLCLLGNQISLSDVYQLETALDDLMLPFTFDVSIYSKLTNKDLISQIDRVGRVVYSKEKPTAQQRMPDENDKKHD